MLYSKKVLRYYHSNKNVGSFPENVNNIGTGIVGSPSCGDVLKLQLKIENGVIIDSKYKAYGCGSAIASSALAAELVQGKTLDQAMDIKNDEIINELGLPPIKTHCSVLAEAAVKAAIASFYTTNPSSSLVKK
ncbi:iron-sulfur cluster assembly scaffold protein [Candidatus Tremblaya phenacola]|uniref:Iron-sulfur cluster assembly scaffold protein IscU n=1 Tax=Candidatus Tremblayella phenacoccinincola TaxID=1010676 RepID=A0A2G0V6Z1_9PROT|nr:iron-sulfur cluster assembly scaffold protein [Candidatus Tremblaya phenacola]PHN16244.1 Iron-sulfur cluster assembly scaffold protein IscU [Candidatus Tremblaya phenacola]